MNKTRSIVPRKLLLSSETIRELDASSTARVAGGYVDRTNTCGVSVCKTCPKL